MNNLPIDIIRTIINEHATIEDSIHLILSSRTYYQKFRAELEYFALAKKDILIYKKSDTKNNYNVKKTFLNDNPIVANIEYSFSLNSDVNLKKYAANLPLSLDGFIKIGYYKLVRSIIDINKLCNSKKFVRQWYRIYENKLPIDIFVTLNKNGNGVIHHNNIIVVDSIIRKIVQSINTPNTYLKSVNATIDHMIKFKDLMKRKPWLYYLFKSNRCYDFIKNESYKFLEFVYNKQEIYFECQTGMAYYIYTTSSINHGLNDKYRRILLCNANCDILINRKKMDTDEIIALYQTLIDMEIPINFKDDVKYQQASSIMSMSVGRSIQNYKSHIIIN